MYKIICSFFFALVCIHMERIRNETCIHDTVLMEFENIRGLHTYRKRMRPPVIFQIASQSFTLRPFSSPVKRKRQPSPKVYRSQCRIYSQQGRKRTNEIRSYLRVTLSLSSKRSRTIIIIKCAIHIYCRRLLHVLSFPYHWFFFAIYTVPPFSLLFIIYFDTPS